MHRGGPGESFSLNANTAGPQGGWLPGFGVSPCLLPWPQLCLGNPNQRPSSRPRAFPLPTSSSGCPPLQPPQPQEDSGGWWLPLPMKDYKAGPRVLGWDLPRALEPSVCRLIPLLLLASFCRRINNNNKQTNTILIFYCAVGIVLSTLLLFLKI